MVLWSDCLVALVIIVFIVAVVVVSGGVGMIMMISGRDALTFRSWSTIGSSDFVFGLMSV